MTAELLALGVSHKTAPVAVRERLAFSEDHAAQFARQAIGSGHVQEAVVISTCNRTEVYLVAAEPLKAEAEVLSMLCERASIRPTELAEAIYSPRNCDAARQLYRVASGLESMVIGEAEIQGQVRRAHEVASAAGCSGPLINRLFAAALTTGKRVRSETRIGERRVSVPSVAVDLATGVLGSLQRRHVVLIGAGETSELTAQALADQGAGTVFIANRHADRALGIAQRFGGSVAGLDRLPEHLVKADIVVSSTSSPHPIVGEEELRDVMAARSSAPLLLIDIAVPRDIDPRCGEIDGVTLYDIDDLQAMIARNLGARAEMLPQAHEIVEEEIRRFARWLGHRDALPTISDLHERADQLVAEVIAENGGRWESASPKDLERVEAIAKAVANRLLHEPTLRLRSLSERRSHAGLQLVRELFGLDEPPLPAQEDADGRQDAQIAEVHLLRTPRPPRRERG
jgi:glutamyl-tRNA reductase